MTLGRPRTARMPSSHWPPVWPQMIEAFGCRAASAARSIGVDSPGLLPPALIQVCWKTTAFNSAARRDQRVGLGAVAPRRDPELQPDHRPVADAAIDLAEAGLDVLGADVDEPEGAMVPVAERLEDLVVLPAELLRRRVDDMPVAHVDDQPLDPHPVGQADQPGHRLIGRPPAQAPVIWQCRSQIIIVVSRPWSVVSCQLPSASNGPCHR